MFSQVIERFEFSRFKTRVVKTKLPESVYAKKLFLATEKFPHVLMGSYPKIYDPECRTEIVLKSKYETDLKEAFDYIRGFVDELQQDPSK